MSKPKAVCLFSGGLDSTTVLYWALSQGYEVVALSLDYGQRHSCEIKAAESILQDLNVRHFTQSIRLPWGGSALTDRQISVPSGRDEKTMAAEIPVTYVPARNTIFLAMALSLAEAEGAGVLLIGANAIDYSGYPDCRPAFLEAFEKTADLGTKAGICGQGFKVVAPLLRLSKKEIIELAVKLKAPLDKTWSCYAGGETPCGECDSCLLRKKGFQEAGLSDPANS